MTTIHHWFRSGRYSLLAHLDTREKHGPLGVVIVSPFGWEDVCAYRPLRFMAQKFADLGIPTLRYDLPGTGDSSGDAQDPGLFNAWVQSVTDAASELRACACVTEVAVVGIHLGAMLAMAASANGADLQQLILWGPAAKGRTLLRELRAAINVERWEYLADEDAPAQPIPGLGAGGFLLAPETMQVLEKLDIATLPWHRKGYPALLLSRDDLPHDIALIKSLDGAAEVTVAAGRGFAAMTTSPQDALFPEETTQTIADFILRNGPPEARTEARPFPAIRAAAFDDAHFTESVYRVDTASAAMFGILTEPATGIRAGNCLVFLNAGGVRHTGPNRMWVEIARRWASHGIPSLRLDLPGIGESDGPQCLDVPSLYLDSLIEQIGDAIETLRKKAGARRFTVIGLCSGACWGFHAAIRYADVRSAILVNPSLLYWDPGVDRRRILPRLGGWLEWTKMAASGIRRGGVGHIAHKVAELLGRTNNSGYIQLGFRNIEQTWPAFERNRKRVTLVFREGEPLLAEMEQAGQLPPAAGNYARCLRVPNGGHTFRPLWAQKMMHDLIDRELTEMLRASLATAPGEGELSTQITHA